MKKLLSITLGSSILLGVPFIIWRAVLLFGLDTKFDQEIAAFTSLFSLFILFLYISYCIGQNILGIKNEKK